MRVAIIHDWLTGMRGGERVLEALLDLYPDAEIFTLLHVRGSVSERIEARPIHTSFIQRIPAAGRIYRRLLPLFPRAIESLDLRGFDLVLSSSHCVAKGVRAPAGVRHICYSHTPMRYVWDQQDAYVGKGRGSAGLRLAMALTAPRLRAWDVDTASRVHRFIANSAHVRDRIRRYYGREAVVVHPPVDIERFHPAPTKDDFYLLLGAPAPYKRIDLALDAFARLGRPLVVAGEGVPERREIKTALARGTVGLTAMGRVSDVVAADLLRRARALLMPGVEDFGITAVEALASGTPVIGFGMGGILDTVRPVSGANGNEAPTGVFFHAATAEALGEAVLEFERHCFGAETLVEAARPFARERFIAAMRDVMEEARGAPRAPTRGIPLREHRAAF